MSKNIIVALDFNNQSDALSLVDKLDPSLCCLKVGSEMFTLFGADFVRSLIARQFNVFLDLKFYDIPNTVARACAAASDLGVWMLTVHASGGHRMMRAAREAVAPFGVTRPLLVAVTVLTSTPESDLPMTGISEPLQEYVCRLARLAQESGMDGVVSSAFDVRKIKSACGASFLAVTPGIRRPCDAADDQSRIVTPASAFAAGSDFLVVGRPITRAKDPIVALRDFFV